jgi:hypothetical protein
MRTSMFEVLPLFRFMDARRRYQVRNHAHPLGQPQCWFVGSRRSPSSAAPSTTELYRGLARSRSLRLRGVREGRRRLCRGRSAGSRGRAGYTGRAPQRGAGERALWGVTGARVLRSAEVAVEGHRGSLSPASMKGPLLRQWHGTGSGCL